MKTKRLFVLFSISLLLVPMLVFAAGAAEQSGGGRME
jgi:hypothetical protein